MRRGDIVIYRKSVRELMNAIENLECAEAKLNGSLLLEHDLFGPILKAGVLPALEGREKRLTHLLEDVYPEIDQ
jgi:hypothetical protein